ncbi:MAG: hypothetical protein KAX42_00590 [Sphaerotilus sp.]|nr:hypothetical protein [Sphaerotilus sp.]
MRIDQVVLTATGDYQQLTASVDGEQIWFRFPIDIPLIASADAFLPVALLEAMVRGVAVSVAAPMTVSSRLSAGLLTFQAILTTWNDEDLQRVPLRAEPAIAIPANDWVVSCYSGGIDSSYTYCCWRNEITHLLLVQGFDTDSDEATWKRNVASRRAFAESEGKRLIPVSSNLRAFVLRRKLSWSVLHGSILGAIGISLRPKRLVIPSSFTYSELFPWGSHPLLDPCWATEATEVVHHGLDAGRSGKTALVATFQNALDNLQVCWRGVDQNCGNCPKCTRTALALHILGKSSRSLPAYSGVQQLRWLKPSNTASLTFTEDLIEFCTLHGHDDVARRLRRYRKRYLLKYHFEEMMKVLFGRAARIVSRRIWPKAWHEDRVKIQSRKTWL